MALAYNPAAGTYLDGSTVFAGDTGCLYNALITTQATNSFSLLNDVTITSTGTLDDYALSGNATVLRWNGASALTLQSITGGTDGRLLIIVNVTAAQELTIANEAGTTAGARFKTPGAGNFAITYGAGVLAIYDSTSSRWRLVADAAAAAAGGSATYAGVWRFPGI